MAFRFKDLTINVVPERVGELGKCVGGTCPQFSLCRNFTCGFITPCRVWTKWGCGWGTCGILSPCQGITQIECQAVTLPDCLGGSRLDETIFQLDDPVLELGVLKQQLQAQLAQVEQLEKQQAEASRPQTLQEAEDLEQKLQGALEELRSIKRNLK
jgi:hypothetical protein